MSIPRKSKIWLGVQAAALAFGNYVGWTSVVSEINYFCDLHGRGLESLTVLTGTVAQHPLLTPCFWGSVVLAITLVWTLGLLFGKWQKSLSKLWLLLVAGTIFAAFNNIPLFYAYFTQPPGSAVGCSPGSTPDSPFLTSCFLGFSAFLTATIAGYIAKRYDPMGK